MEVDRSLHACVTRAGVSQCARASTQAARGRIDRTGVVTSLEESMSAKLQPPPELSGVAPRL